MTIAVVMLLNYVKSYLSNVEFTSRSVRRIRYVKHSTISSFT
ncbi:MAG: hypothetical protein QW680_11835 [Pyrobaculum sp.]